MDQGSVVPMVIISACGLLCLALYNRLAYVTRLRALQRERLAEHKRIDPLREDQREKGERWLALLEGQTEGLLERAKWLQRCLFFLLIAIISLIFSSIGIGLGMLFAHLQILSVLFFLLGLFSILCGLICALFEMARALSPIQQES